jgi:hypothetical protein
LAARNFIMNTLAPSKYSGATATAVPGGACTRQRTARTTHE